jgi:hypothetical protein
VSRVEELLAEAVKTVGPEVTDPAVLARVARIITAPSPVRSNAGEAS